MTGLEKIINRIEVDADNMVQDIKEKSAAQCKAIISEAEAKAQDIIIKSKKEADKRYEEIIKKAESAASLEEQKLILLTKQQIIKLMISNSINAILNLPTDKYFELVYKLVEKYSLKSEGLIALNKSDLSRLPEDFDDKVNSVSDGKLSICREPAEINGGFILTYGDVDVNCSISALVHENREKITDALADILFL